MQKLTVRRLSSIDTDIYIDLVNDVMNNLPREDFFLPFNAPASTLCDPYKDVYGGFVEGNLVCSVTIEHEEKAYDLGRAMVYSCYKGCGYITELYKIVLSNYNGTMFATAHPYNIPSCRALERAGFKAVDFKVIDGYDRLVYRKD